MDAFKTNRSAAYRTIDDDRQERIMRGLKRDWQRHHEIREQYRTFARYVAATRHNVTFGA